jgi:formamidopyrimidine-DNA glycosylase
MPELPEVETLRRDLLPGLVGSRIGNGWVADSAPRLVQGLPPETFIDNVRGRTVTDIGRRGKYLIVHFDNGTFLIVHLRMTGQLLLLNRPDEADAYVRARFELDDGRELRYRDVRKFGTMWHVPDPQLVVGTLGVEPLEGGFTTEALRAVFARRKAPVKAVLLDQRVIAGLGNIYADEALFFAGVHPLTPARDLSRQRVEAVRAGVVRALGQALDNRGSTFRDYVDSQGRPGGNREHLYVYGRTDQPCLRCGRAIQRTHAGGRSTHYCPNCQRRPRSRTASRGTSRGVGAVPS